MRPGKEMHACTFVHLSLRKLASREDGRHLKGRTPSLHCCTTRFSLPTTFPYRLRCATPVYTCTLPHVSSLPRIGSTVWNCSEASMCVRDTRDQNCSRSVPWGADKQVDRPACNLVMLLCMFCGGMFEASLKHGWIPRMQSNNLQCQPSHGTK